MILRFPVLLLFGIAIFSIELHAQSLGAENIEPGASSDSILALLRGEYTAIDTIVVDSPFPVISIRMAPVKLAGLDGLLILNVDSAGTITDLRWRRGPENSYHRRGIWMDFTGWDSWETPTRKESAHVRETMMAHHGAVTSYAAPVLPADSRTLEMGAYWEYSDPLPVSVAIRHDGHSLEAYARLGHPLRDAR